MTGITRAAEVVRKDSNATCSWDMAAELAVYLAVVGLYGGELKFMVQSEGQARKRDAGLRIII